MEDELQPCGTIGAAFMLAANLRDIANIIERNPELADLDDWYDAAELLLMDLDALDHLDADDL